MATALQHKRTSHKNFYVASGMPRYSKSVLEAMKEAKEISRNPNVKSYNNMEELKAALRK